MSSRSLIALVGAPLLLCAAPSHAEFTGVIATTRPADIAGYGPARVVRLYATFDNPDDRLMVVFGNEPFPMNITAGQTPFYHDAVGGVTAPSQAGFGLFCSLRNDTYVEIGRASSDSGDAVLITPDFEIGATEMATMNGAWHRIPDDPLTLAGGDGRVFFGQFTVPADAPPLLGMANLTMREDGENGTRFGLVFTDMDAEPSPVVADVDGDLNIDVDDLIEVIIGWGPCEACPGECVECFCAPDVNEDGVVDGSDLIDVLMQFGSL